MDTRAAGAVFRYVGEIGLLSNIILKRILCVQARTGERSPCSHSFPSARCCSSPFSLHVRSCSVGQEELR